MAAVETSEAAEAVGSASHFIDGKEVDSASGRTFDAIEPSTGGQHTRRLCPRPHRSISRHP